ncbi:DNA-binding protein [Rodentibacter genomosp. 1]|uniref:DNA-binding protein n=1 Tax=Rodentibacter genomosp. 1 TaxID=1908264 RepID=A0A1V3J877_9PAST|nr:KilA-N domain-containing protein [Rodentibacter genomosp. 1]OOF51323.1 DNA-binding protein [Rodentibacter genomosp. 1]
MTNLSILKTSIRSLDGLYSLTDLHKASGGDEKHKPVLFLRLDQTKDLISEIENDKVQICTLPVKTVRGGKNPSTYACEELVLAYATWISPKFHLVVLRAFLAMHRNEPKQLALPEPTVDREFQQTMIKILNYARQYEQFQRAICTKRGEEQRRQIEFFFSDIVGDDGYLFIFRNNITQDIQKATDMLYSQITR